MFSDNVYHNYQFDRPAELALRVLDELESSWYGLTLPVQTELESILAEFRVELYQARDDMARGRALTKLLYALEAAAATPASIRARLAASHRPTMRNGGARWDSAAARAFVVRIDGLIGAAPELAPSPGPASSAEEFPEAVAVVERVLERLNQRWSELTLRTQEQAKLWLQAYERALRSADNDWLRLEATHEFLRHLKDEAEIWEKVYTAFRGPARPGPQPQFPVGAQVMTADDAARVRALIDSNPATAVAKTPQANDGDHGPRDGAAPPETEAEAFAETAAASVIDFHTDVRFPGQVSTFDRAIPLRVRLTLEKAEGTVVDAGVSIEFVTPEPQPVLVVCNAEGFIVDTQDTINATRTILVYQDRDSQWAVFPLTPDPEAGPGTRRISLDFYHRERLAGTSSFQVEVRDRPPIDQTPVEPEPLIDDRAADGSVISRVSARFTPASPDAPKPDFVLRIALSAGQRRLSYTLHSPAGRLGWVFQRMGSVELKTDDPRVFMENTLMRLSQMARASRKKLTDVEAEEARDKLREIGWYLYDELFTPQLRQAYRQLYQLRQKKGPLSLLIVSDEPWIPWEMVLPHEGLPDEDFLCAQFRMTRWLEGHGLPEDFSLRQARVVVPKSNLASVKKEQDYFRQQLPPTIHFDGQWLETASQVKAALRQRDVQWFHFACHGDFDPLRSDESVLVLQGEPFTPNQIVGPMIEGVAASRPLVFLNACHTGETGFSLTGMGGWAARFVRAGASAFIGSLWEVNDVLAAEFAIAFYDEMLAGQTLGDAFHAARLHIRDLDEANPTWLAYTLYADPNGRVKAGDR
jgi:hypothetical protein